MATSAPTTELGTPLANASWAQPVLTQKEIDRDLRYPRSVQATYPAMLNDAQIDGLYRGATLPIRAYRYWLDPNGAAPATVQRISTNYGLPIGEKGVIFQRRAQGRFRWDRHIEDALRAIVYGHYFFEQVGDIDTDLLWHLRKLAPRPPATILEIKPARDGGLESIKVPALTPQRDVTAMGRGVTLPVGRLLAYVWDQEGANWIGRSMLRSSYRPWKLKDAVIRGGATNIIRGGGIPYVEAPDGATDPQMAKLHALATAIRIGDGAGAAIPHGATLKFAAADGGKAAVDFVRLQNEEMARAWLMMFLQSGQSSSGHGSTEQVGQQINYFAQVQQAIAGFVCDVFNEHMLEDDVEWNDGPDAEYAPLVRFTPMGDPLDALASELDNAQVEGALPADSPTAAAVRGDRPRRPRRAAAAATPPSPAEQSGTDFADLQTTYLQALTDIKTAWADVQATVIDELVTAVAAATTVAEVAALTVPAVTGVALAAVLVDVVEHGAQTAIDAATAQGGTVDAPDLQDVHALIGDAADATATLIAGGLARSAASRAVALWGPDADPAEVAADVRTHLESLSGADAEYEAAGLVSRAQNEGRFAGLDQYPVGSRFYASAVNDTNRCGPCGEEDDTEFPSMSEARRDFPTGGFLGCEGRNRCRCTVVAVLPETPGQA